MGQKCNPTGLRIGVIKNWDSRWYAKKGEFGDTLVEDYKLRNYLLDSLHGAGVPKVEIERDAKRVRINIHCAKPGMVIGKQGAEIEKLRVEIEKLVGKPALVNVAEVKSPDLDAQLVAESIAAQLEKRIAFRRAMKQAIGRTMRLGAKGIKISCGGRLNGAEIARTEHYHEGTIPLQTIRADIDYGFAEANTTYGKIGIKCWIYKGEILADKMAKGYVPSDRPRDGRRNDRGDRKGGDRRGGDRRQNFAGSNRAPRQQHRDGGDKNVNA